MPSKSVVPSAVQELFAKLPHPVRELALSARQLVLAAVPDAIELADAKASVVGYGYGAGYKDMVTSLILSKNGVKIGIVQGASLPDPASLLKGAGKVHRHVEVRSREQLQRPEVRDLIEAALSAWRLRSQSELRAKSVKDVR